MIHIRSPILTTFLIMRIKVAEPPGGCYGTDNKTDRYPMGATGSSANEHGIGRYLSQLHDYFDVRRGPVEGLDLRGFGLLYGYGGSSTQALSTRRSQGLASHQATGSAQSSNAGIYRADETGRTNQSADSGIWFFHLVGGEIGRASGQGNTYSVQRRSIAKAPTPRRILHPPAQAYPQGQKG